MNASLEQAVKVLKAGGVVVYPTDTAYGLAVDATNAKAVEKLYQLKGRNFKKPIHVIISPKRLDSIVKLNPNAKKLIKKFWPGPLTIVLPLKASGNSWQKLSAGTKTLGIRYPSNLTAQTLCEALKKPITTTSANISGQNDCYSIAEVKKQFRRVPRKVAFYYLDGGKLKKTKPSTVVSLIKGVTILRDGPISEKQIKNVLDSSKN